MFAVTHLIWIILLSVSIVANASTRIAVLPSFSDMTYEDDSRRWLAGYDAALQAELLGGWDTEILSRAGLSAVVFEQKLAAAKDSEISQPLVLPADILLLSVLDVRSKELRLHAVRVQSGMKLGSPRVFRYKNLPHLAAQLPKEAAAYVAQFAKLEKRPTMPPSRQAAIPGNWTCALLEPVFSHRNDEAMASLSPLFRAALEQALVSGNHPAKMVEREKLITLLDEKNLAASGMMATNAASDIGRLAGADLILTPFIHPVSADEVHSTLFAIDVRSGRILAARAWKGQPLDAPPAGSINSLLSGAFQAMGIEPQVNRETASIRHFEADFLISLSKSFLGLRQNIPTVAELSLTFADAALALSHDDPARMGKAVAEYLQKAIPGPRYALQMKLSPNNDWIMEMEKLIQNGRLAMLHEQGRKIFHLPVHELAKERADGDLRRLASYYLQLGEPGNAYNALTAGGRTHQQLVGNNSLYERVAESLLAMERFQECVEFIDLRGRFSTYTTTLLLDALHASGQRKREYHILWVNVRNTLGRADVDLLARFLNLAVDYGNPVESLVAFSRFANTWHKNHHALRVPFIKLRIAAGRKDKAISDAQLFWLAARHDKKPDQMKEVASLLGKLGSKPLDTLPLPADFKIVPQDARIDLFHDQTISPQFAAKVAGDLANCWGCEVHVVGFQFDPSKLSFYNPLNQSLQGIDLARGYVSFTSKPGPRLQTIILTQHKLRSTTHNYQGDIYGAPSPESSVNVVSTHYFKLYKHLDSRSLQRITAIAAASLPSVHRKLNFDTQESSPQSERFQAFQPDLMASNGRLYMADHQLGISPSTGAILRTTPPNEWLEGAENCRQRDLELERAEPLPDSAYFRNLEATLNTKPIIIQPDSNN